MNIGNIILWGFSSTIVLTTIMAASKPMGLTRMDIPFLLGTMVTSNRNRAPAVGFILHLAIGLLFALLYAVLFDAADIHTWWFGALVGFVHGCFVLSVGMQIIASFHPRMAHPYQGPTPTKQLQPPGFFALNYGIGTPIVTLIVHIIFGAVLGVFL